MLAWQFELDLSSRPKRQEIWGAGTSSQLPAAWAKRADLIANFSPFFSRHMFLGRVLSSTYFLGVCAFHPLWKHSSVCFERQLKWKWCLVATQVINIQRVLSYSSKAKLWVLTGPQHFPSQLECPAMAGQKARNSTCSQPGRATGFHERNWNSVTTFSMAMYKPLIKQYKFKKKYIHCQTCHYSKRMCSKQAVLELRPCSLTDLLPMVTGRIALLPKRFYMTVGHAGPIWWWK